MFGWEKETQHEKIMKELNKLEKGDYDQAYKESEAIYESVKKHYLRKIKSPGFDIKIEKIRLEQNLGMHNSVATTSSINYYGAILCALLPMFFETTGILNNKLNGGITSLSLILVVVFIVRIMKKDLEKIKPIDKFNFICLRVLSDLENEIEQLQQKKMITANSEVAATKQGKEKCRKKK